MSSKPDYLRECMSDVPGMPIDDFNKNWCMVCNNPACSRSSSNNQLFTRRAENWKQDLFLNVKRAADDDPKYSSIRSKSFAPAVQSYEVFTSTPGTDPGPKWFTPVEVEQEDGKNPEDPPDTDPAPMPTPSVSTAPEGTPEPERVTSPVAARPSTQTQVNTSFSQGAVIRGATQPKSEVVMQPGQTYTFGEDE